MGIFKGKINVGEVVTGAMSGIDKLFFTKEEKADFNNKISDSLAKHVESTLSENTVRSKSRRFVTHTFVGLYAALVLIQIYISFTDIVNQKIWDLITDQTLSTAIIMILAFYYGGYYAGGLLSKAKEKTKDK